jgi:hypothetical protein
VEAGDKASANIKSPNMMRMCNPFYYDS